ncbi:MAG TPA: TonB-dependent receptor [Tenuifilaceae bacterium]|nr:TonB-dependent receptor [Tenuifilaceae bacterium]HPN22328.1 TonB-dependent receptor [Tenuifilaceae bacterium]
MNKKYLVNEQFGYFRKWSNKNYSVFSSIKKVVLIGVLPLTYNLLAMPMATFGQSDTVSISKNVDINEVVINANRKASTYSELTRVVRVVSRDELGTQQATSLQEILERVASVDIRQRGGHGVQADINFRGGTFDQTLVLLNGVNISDPQTGHHSMNIPISIESIQRIEILQGPGAREFGQGAFAGAINIITEPENQNNIQQSTFAGNYGLFKTSLSSNFGTKQFRTFIATSYDKSDGYIQNTDFASTNIYLHSTLKSRVGQFSLFSGYQDKGFGSNSFYTAKYPNQYEATKSLLGGLKYQKEINQINIGFDAYYRTHLDRFELFRDNPAVWYTGHNYHKTDVYGVKPTFQFANKDSKTVLGVELRREEILSNKLGDSLVNPIAVWGEDSIFYYKGGSRNMLNAFLSETLYLGDFIVAGGIQYSYNNKFNSIWTWGGDISYLLNQNLRFFSSVNRTFRTPTYTDLYYEGATNIGNPNLNPEFATTYEFGTKYNSKLISAQIAAFYRKGEDIIDWVKGATDTKWRTVNYTDLSTYGADFSARFNLEELTPLVKTISINYSYVTSDTVGGDLDSYYVLDFLKHNLSVNFSHKVTNMFSFSWSARYQDRNGQYSNASSIKVDYPSFWLFDARLTFERNMVKIFVDASNIFDKKYVDIANAQQPGRWLGAGLVLKIDL